MRYHFAVGCLAMTVLGGAAAQSVGVYTCTDDHGRRLMADRPIPECLDREQRVLGPSGVERARRAPVPTQAELERAAQEKQRRLQEQERMLEQHRIDQALLLRYPDSAAHEAERLQQVRHLDELQTLARARLQDLEQAYVQAQKDQATLGSPPPPAARKAVQAAQAAMLAQKRSIEVNEINRQRIMLRFDDEARRLEKLWADTQP